MASLSLKDICKVYPNGFEAVKNFNLEIQDKEFIIFVGPSGCGKSTTLRMIAGLEEISSGELKIGDRLVNDVEPKDRDIAMVFQNYALYPHMTVRDNMAFGLRLRKVPKDEIEKMVKEAAKILDLTNLLDRKPKALSGGQRQRVAMGRAIVRNPKVFLMDEPLSNLDAKLRVSMRTEIRRIQQEAGITAIYVTHDQSEAMAISDKVIIMNKGLVEQISTPQEAYYYPNNKFVADFIGEANFLNAKVKGQDTVVIDGAEVKCATGNMAAGDDCSVVLRPEGAFLGDTGAIKGKVMYSCFMGAYQDYHVQVADALVKIQEYNPKNKKIYNVGDEAFLNFEDNTLYAL